MLEIPFVVAFFLWLGISVANETIWDVHNESTKYRAILDDGADRVGNKITLTSPVTFELINHEMLMSTAESAAARGYSSLSLPWSSVQGEPRRDAGIVGIYIHACNGGA